MALPFEQQAKEKELEDPVSISIGEMLRSSSATSPQPCISRVPNYLRQVKIRPINLSASYCSVPSWQRSL
ncbi:hypothetical protein V6N13_048452 [Hibiscus sabdariffa]|uniref:Uncharacterized protein n=2 Tax=Hibiscus sabdariffa TaxID=183260 RepID=A0ABR2F7D3_9ROSI